MICFNDFYYDFDEMLTGDIIWEKCCIILTTYNKFAYHTAISHLENRMIFFENTENIITTLKSFQFVPTVGLYLDHIELFKEKVLPYVNKEIVLVCHNGDLPFEDLDICNHIFIKKVYAQNLNILHNKAVLLPIGLRNKMFNQKSIEKINLLNQEPVEFKRKLFTCMDFNTCELRKALKVFLENNNFEITPNNLDYRKYLNEINKSEFVLAPAGNGFDTHRFFETVYLKSIPICIVNDSNKHFYQNLKNLGYFFIPINSFEELLEYR